MGPACAATQAESATLPDGNEERFSGYGIMGLPFASGHVLAMRRFPASSIGPPYTSVWHRTPAGDWTFWQDQPAQQGCARYFSTSVNTVAHTEIHLEWESPDQMLVTIPHAGLTWRSVMQASSRTRLFNMFGSATPDRMWRSSRLLNTTGPMAGRLLGVGAIALAGRVPNGQTFIVNPRQIWYAAHATATLDNTDLGPVGPLAEPARLGDFAIPQRGVFAIGRAFFR